MKLFKDGLMSDVCSGAPVFTRRLFGGAGCMKYISTWKVDDSRSIVLQFSKLVGFVILSTHNKHYENE